MVLSTQAVKSQEMNWSVHMRHFFIYNKLEASSIGGGDGLEMRLETSLYKP